jgi:hypothetical protein
VLGCRENGLFRLRKRGIAESTDSNADQVRHSLWLPKHGRPTFWTEVEGHQLSDDRVAGKSLRPAIGNPNRGALETGRDTEQASRSALAVHAMAHRDAPRFSFAAELQPSASTTRDAFGHERFPIKHASTAGDRHDAFEAMGQVRATCGVPFEAPGANKKCSFILRELWQHIRKELVEAFCHCRVCDNRVAQTRVRHDRQHRGLNHGHDFAGVGLD